MNAIENAIFYASENPQRLAKLFEVMLYPKEIPAHITATVDVANGTALASVPKPATVTVNDGFQNHEIPVTWAGTTSPTYNASTAGTYVCVGTLGTLPATLKNSGDYKFNLSIVVAEEETP